MSFVSRVLGVFALLLLSACGDAETGTARHGIGTLPPDQVVFRLGSTGHGWRPSMLQQVHTPVLVIHGDGRVVFTDGTSTESTAPPEYRTVQADPLAVSRFAADLEQQHLVDLGTEVGSPSVTDQATTRVSLHGHGDPTEVRVYAFSPRFEETLTPTEREHRAALRAAIAEAWTFAEGRPEPYVPTSVTVHQLPGPAPSGTPAPPWPGPHPAGFVTPDGRAGARGVVAGEAAAAVYAAARENPHGYWTVGDTVMRLIVDPVP